MKKQINESQLRNIIKGLIKENFEESNEPNTEEIQQRLDAGEDPKEIFEEVFGNSFGWHTVKLNEGNWNFINEHGQLLSKKWFDKTYDFSFGFGIVVLGGKYNYIDEQGKLLSNLWFDYLHEFGCEGNSPADDDERRLDYGEVFLNGKCYVLDREGRLCDYNTLEPINKNSLNESKTHKNTKMKINESQLKNIIKGLIKEISYQTVNNAKEKSGKILDIMGDLCHENYNLRDVAYSLNELSKLQPENKQYADLYKKAMSLFSEINELCDRIQDRDDVISSHWMDRGEELRNSIENKAGIQHIPDAMDYTYDDNIAMDKAYDNFTDDEKSAYQHYM